MTAKRWIGWMANGCALTMLAAGALVACRGRSANAATLVIDHGGTFSGTWESDDAKVPCVRIDTDQPVIIDDSSLRGKGDLIVSSHDHAKITVRNTSGVGLNPNVAGKCAGRFASIERFSDVTIENCSMENTAGIYLLDYIGDKSATQSVHILRNRARNIDGRRSDGHGGYLKDAELVQFAQLDKVRHVAGVEIAWNEVINEPGASAVEDNISIYLSSGVPESPIRIHDNFIRGAFPLDAEKQPFSGGGIMLGDGVDKKGADGDPAYVVAEHNQVLDTVNYGIAISAGHYCQIIANRIVSAGALADGRVIDAQNVGAYVWDSYKAGPDRFFENSGRDNLIGWVKGKDRNDWWRPGAASWENNTHWDGPITRELYENEQRRWVEKLKMAKVNVGPATAPASSRQPKA